MDAAAAANSSEMEEVVYASEKLIDAAREIKEVQLDLEGAVRNVRT